MRCQILIAIAMLNFNPRNKIRYYSVLWIRMSGGCIKLDLDSILQGYGFLTMLPSGDLLNHLPLTTYGEQFAFWVDTIQEKSISTPSGYLRFQKCYIDLQRKKIKDYKKTLKWVYSGFCILNCLETTSKNVNTFILIIWRKAVAKIQRYLHIKISRLLEQLERFLKKGNHLYQKI